MPPTLAAPRGPRYTIDPGAGLDTSAAVREFLDATSARHAGVRFPLLGLGAMRAGRQTCVHVAITRFLGAGLRIGLPRDWAERLAGFVSAEIDRLWTHGLPALDEARRRAARADAEEDVAEIEALTRGDLASLQKEERALRVALAMEHVRLAAIQKEIGRREREHEAPAR